MGDERTDAIPQAAVEAAASLSPQGEDHELREKIADELARNDECGPGPVSRQEYLDDAEVILSMIRTYGGTQEAHPDPPQGEDHETSKEDR